MNNISVYGLGYIGLPTALLLADNNYNVIGIDIDEVVVDSVNMAQLHIAEKGLNDLLFKAVKGNKLSAQISASIADIHIICVPTPFTKDEDDLKSDMSYVEAAIISIASVYREDDVIILESTVPVGATEKMQQLFKKQRPDINNVHIVYCPERVLPGNLLYELRTNDRIIGGNAQITLDKVRTFYKNFVNGEIYTTDFKTAELSKLVENSYRDVNIAFANELSIICEEGGIDVFELIGLVNKHPRVNVLQPGIGVGGHCIAVDPWFIVEYDKHNSQLIKLARERNLFKTKFILEKIYQHLELYEAINGTQPSIGFLGLSYKPDIDDLRESPAAFIVREVQKKCETVYVADPNFPNLTEFQMINGDEVLTRCDLIFGLVAHKEFKEVVNTGLFDESKYTDFCGIKKNVKNEILNNITGNYETNS